MLQKLFVYLTIAYAFNICVINGYNMIGRKRSSLTDEPPSIESDQIIEGTLGKRVSMKCLVKNVKNYKIAWYFNGIFLTLDNIRIRNDKRISIENSKPHEWKLIIDSIDSSDEGYYSCRLTNGLKKLMYLKVGIPPKFIGNNNANHVIVNTLAGENITLSCPADGSPTPVIYWYTKKKLVGTGSHLRLGNISQFEHSEYECVARNNILPDPSRKFKINVHFQPQLNIMYNLKYDTDSGELHLLCEIAGNPIHAIHWYKDGLELTDDDNEEVVMLHNRNNKEAKNKNKDKRLSIHTTHLSLHKFVSKLRVKEIDQSNNGVYKCAVSGYHGTAEKEVLVTDIHDSSQEVNYETNLLGRGARSNITKVAESAYTQDLNSGSDSRITGISSSVYLLFSSFLIVLMNSNFVKF